MKEPRGKGKAETSCRVALNVMVKMRNWYGASSVLERYGNYLLLIGQDKPIGEVRVFSR